MSFSGGGGGGGVKTTISIHLLYFVKNCGSNEKG